jgi:hypothetical protein
VIAPALRGRALRVDGWYSTNILPVAQLSLKERFML